MTKPNISKATVTQTSAWSNPARRGDACGAPVRLCPPKRTGSTSDAALPTLENQPMKRMPVVM